VHVAPRPYVIAGMLAAATSVIIVTPVATKAIEIPRHHIDVRLIDASDSILNVPLNLFYDLANVPYNEIQAMNTFSEALLFSGPWNATSATNLLGIDPGDPAHYEAVVNLMVPFPALSGMGQGEFNWTAGLGQQLLGFQAAEFPINGACSATECLPFEPTSPITGLTNVDNAIWTEQILTGQQAFPLVDNWLQVPLSKLLSGYTFDPSAPGSVDTSGAVYPLFGILGTTGPENSVPWSGDTYTLEPWVPVQNFLNSLMAPPPTDGIAGATGGIAILGTGIEVPTFTEFAQALEAAAAANIVAFDPFIPGSGVCDALCTTLVTDLGLNYPQLTQDIANIFPGNPMIDQWLAAYNAGTANVPTAAQIAAEIAGLQQGPWDFGNPSPPADWSVGGTDLSNLAPFFQTLWTDLGIQPGQGTEAAATASLDPISLSSGLDLSALSTELTTLLSGGASELSSQLSADLTALLADLSTALPANLATTLPADLLSSF
jgi:hypothetical protein